MLILKSIVYRIIRILLLLVVSFIILGNINLAISISSIDAIIATIYYYYFDKIWFIFEPKIKSLLLLIKYRKFNNK